jgi:deazaflavin-dependent oxidoreductase (nitroreductase family)
VPITFAQPNPNLLHRSVQAAAATALGTKLLVPTLHRLDKWVLQVSGGRTTAVGLTIGLPVVWLTTTGAKSGEPRTVPLLGSLDGAAIVLIASNFGQTHHPAWYHNLRKNPQATITVDDQSGQYEAREVTGAEYDRLWQRAVSLYAGYAAYKQRTGGRAIPIMLLEPL